MRVTSELWIAALMRRSFASGGFAAIMRRGAAQAGAIILILRDRTGMLTLYGPAAQASYDQAHPDERRFSEWLRTEDEDRVAARIDKETRFDTDLWVVELELSDPDDHAMFEIEAPSG